MRNAGPLDDAGERVHLTQVAFLALFLAALTAAFARGGRTERAGAALMLAAALGTPLVQMHGFLSLEVGIAAVDALLLAGLLWLAFASERRWTIYAAGFQVVSVLTHFARFKAGSVHGDVYGHLLVLWSYPVVTALLWGSLSRIRSLEMAVADPGNRQHGPATVTNDTVSVNSRRLAATVDDHGLLVRLLTLHGLGTESATLATFLMDRDGSFAGAVAIPPAKLRRWNIDERVIDAFAFARSTTRSSLRRKLETRPSLTDPQVTIDYLHSELAHLPHEQFRVLYLNSRYRLIYDEIHGEGTVTEAPVYPREVLKRAIETGAVYLVLAHNHPGGDPTPSRADIVSTRAIAEAARSIGVTIVDHYVISPAGHVSMKASGLL